MASKTAQRTTRSSAAAAQTPAITVVKQANTDTVAQRPRGRSRKTVPEVAAVPGAAAAAAAAAPPASAAVTVDPVSSASLGYPPSAQGTALLLAIRRALISGADPTKSEGMRRYMKSALPCYGGTTPERRIAFTAVFADVNFESGNAWAAAVAAIWDGATHREEKYAAIHLASHKSAKDYRLDPAVALPLLKGLIASGSWWDYVDDLSAHHLGELLRAHPALVSAELVRWSLGDVLWLRRAAITAQLTSKGDQFDWPLLLQVIKPAMADETFWLRKAIGWSLRQVARERPQEVKAFVRDNYEQLSTLSRREAMKHLGGDKKPKQGKEEIEDALENDESTVASTTAAPPPTPPPTRGRKRKASAAQ